jgi:3-oxoacyl-[acyl-carrier protein] reductase
VSKPVALVTGASRGIGRATALALAGNGFDLGLLARSADALGETQRLAQQAGATAATTVADVTDPDAVAQAVRTIEQHAGAIGVLVNNAGSLRAIGPLWDVDAGDWWADVLTSVGGAFNLCRAVLPGMIERRSGRIVNLTSYAAVRPAPYQSGYGSGKAALASMSESLAAEVGEHGISVFSVAAGFTQTAMTEHLTSSEAGRRWLPAAGTGRTVDAEQTARLIAFLAGGAADALSGRFLHTLDEVEVLLASLDEIELGELYAPRIRRLPGR